MIQYIPTHVGLAHDGQEPTAFNYSRREYAQSVKFDAGEHYWGLINEAFITDGEKTFTQPIEMIEVTPGTVVTVESDLKLGH